MVPSNSSRQPLECANIVLCSVFHVHHSKFVRVVFSVIIYLMENVWNIAHHLPTLLRHLPAMHVFLLVKCV